MTAGPIVDARGSVPVEVLLCDSASVRTTLLDALSSALAVRRSRLSIARDAFGKPYVAHPTTDLRFSVSHTHDLAVLAFARGVDVGIDVERLRHDVTQWTLWHHVLGEDELEWMPRDRPARTRALLGAWVAKEAILKAAGTGLGVDPRRIELDAQYRVLSAPVGLGEPESWSISLLHLDGAVAAVACRAEPVASGLAARRARGPASVAPASRPSERVGRPIPKVWFFPDGYATSRFAPIL